MRGNRRHRAVLIAGAALALLASACGDSDNAGTTPSPSPPAAGSPGAVVTANPTGGVVTLNTPVPGHTFVLPTPTVLTDDNKTAMAAKAAVEMVDFADTFGRFTVKVPRGWALEPSKNGLTATLPRDPIAATVGVYCLAGKTTIADIENFDQAIMTSANIGKIPFGDAVPVKIGDVDGVSIHWSGHVDGITIDRIFVYFVGNNCAWRIQMTTWPPLTTADLMPILDTMLSSFAFKS